MVMEGHRLATGGDGEPPYGQRFPGYLRLRGYSYAGEILESGANGRP